MPDTERERQQLRIDHYARQEVQHPQVGPIELDFDILTVPDRERQVVIFTAELESAAYRDLQLLRVLGTQQLNLTDGTTGAVLLVGEV